MKPFTVSRSRNRQHHMVAQETQIKASSHFGSVCFSVLGHKHKYQTDSSKRGTSFLTGWKKRVHFHVWNEYESIARMLQPFQATDLTQYGVAIRT